MLRLALSQYGLHDDYLVLIWYKFLSDIVDTDPHEADSLSDYSAPYGCLNASIIHFLHWPPKSGRTRPHGSILDTTSPSIDFVTKTFRHESQLLFDLFCKAIERLDGDGKPRTDLDLYERDPLLALHFELCEIILANLKHSPGPRYIFLWGRKVQKWWDRFQVDCQDKLEAEGSDVRLDDHSNKVLPNQLQVHIIRFLHPMYLRIWAPLHILEDVRDRIFAVSTLFDSVDFDLSIIESFIASRKRKKEPPQAFKTLDAGFVKLINDTQLSMDAIQEPRSAASSKTTRSVHGALVKRLATPAQMRAIHKAIAIQAQLPRTQKQLDSIRKVQKDSANRPKTQKQLDHAENNLVMMRKMRKSLAQEAARRKGVEIQRLLPPTEAQINNGRKAAQVSHERLVERMSSRDPVQYPYKCRKGCDHRFERKVQRLDHEGRTHSGRPDSSLQPPSDSVACRAPGCLETFMAKTKKKQSADRTLHEKKEHWDWYEANIMTDKAKQNKAKKDQARADFWAAKEYHTPQGPQIRPKRKFEEIREKGDTSALAE